MLNALENKLWFTPECTGNGPDGHVGPSPRAFHVAATIDCHMFVFGGRFGGKRYGGWDGKKWLTDVYVLDTISLEWTELSISGSLPPPRCGHAATMVEKRLLVFGGRGGGGPILGDLWALKGLIEEGTAEENETPGWTQLKLPGQPPSPRCGHSMTSGGHNLLLFGGHGTGGWLSRYDVYHNDCVILDRVDTNYDIDDPIALLYSVSVQWKHLSTSNEPPPARAYHSMTYIGSRYLLFGGFDGKSTFDDIWWLVPEDDPIAKRLQSSPLTNLPARKGGTLSSGSAPHVMKEGQNEESPIVELQKRLQILSSPSPKPNIVDELRDGELLELSSAIVGGASNSDQVALIQALREHWQKSSPKAIQLRELGPLLRDYQHSVRELFLLAEVICRTRDDFTMLSCGHCNEAKRQKPLNNLESLLPSDPAVPPREQEYHFYHMTSASQMIFQIYLASTVNCSQIEAEKVVLDAA
ncbi:hypothetical protein ACLOJK_031256 [Asimina triloba]